MQRAVEIVSEMRVSSIQRDMELVYILWAIMHDFSEWRSKKTLEVRLTLN